MPRNPRNYKVEYKQLHGKSSEIKKRAERNEARKEAGLKKGDRKEADHIKPLSKGGSNKPSNVRITSKGTNRRKYNK